MSSLMKYKSSVVSETGLQKKLNRTDFCLVIFYNNMICITAVFCNSHPTIIKVLAALNSHFDCSSKVFVFTFDVLVIFKTLKTDFSSFCKFVLNCFF